MKRPFSYHVLCANRIKSSTVGSHFCLQSNLNNKLVAVDITKIREELMSSQTESLTFEKLLIHLNLV